MSQEPNKIMEFLDQFRSQEEESPSNRNERLLGVKDLIERVLDQADGDTDRNEALAQASTNADDPTGLRNYGGSYNKWIIESMRNCPSLLYPWVLTGINSMFAADNSVGGPDRQKLQNIIDGAWAHIQATGGAALSSFEKMYSEYDTNMFQVEAAPEPADREFDFAYIQAQIDLKGFRHLRPEEVAWALRNPATNEACGDIQKRLKYNIHLFDLSKQDLRRADLTNARFGFSFYEFECFKYKGRLMSFIPKNPMAHAINSYSLGEKTMAEKYRREPCILHKTDLRDADMRGAYLTGVDLSTAMIAGADFRYAHVAGRNHPKVPEGYRVRYKGPITGPDIISIEDRGMPPNWFGNDNDWRTLCDK